MASEYNQGASQQYNNCTEHRHSAVNEIVHSRFWFTADLTGSDMSCYWPQSHTIDWRAVAGRGGHNARESPTAGVLYISGSLIIRNFHRYCWKRGNNECCLTPDPPRGILFPLCARPPLIILGLFGWSFVGIVLHNSLIVCIVYEFRIYHECIFIL